MIPHLNTFHVITEENLVATKRLFPNNYRRIIDYYNTRIIELV